MTRPSEYPTIRHLTGGEDVVPAYTAPLDDDRLLNSGASCGMSALWTLGQSSPESVVRKVLEERGSSDKYIKEAFVVFSDIAYTGGYAYRNTFGGHKLAKHIKDNKIGEIMESPIRINPNTGNHIQAWIWMPPHLDVRDKYMPRYGMKKRFVEGLFQNYTRNDGTEVY